MTKADFVLTPAVGKYFVGRKKLLQELVKELADIESHIGFCLYGRRRIGKTSVLMELKQILHEKKNIVVVYLSLYDIADLSLKTFAEELVSAIVGAYQEKGLFPLQIKIRNLLNAPLDIVLELLKSARMEATILDHIKILFEYGEKKKNYSEYVRHAFNIGGILAKVTSTKCIVLLDEFPEILNVENGLQLVKMLRTQYEVQKRTALVISGSIRKTLELVTLSESSPFYKQLVPKHLLPFSEEETEEFLRSYLGKVNKKEVKKLHELTEGLPFYLQYIGRSTRYAGNIEEAVRRFIEQEGNIFFKEEFEKLNDKEKLIVIALAKGKKNLTEIAKELNEPTTTIGRYLPMLMEKELAVKESRGIYRLLDCLFGYWLKQKYVGNY